jgi:hypothetical protein
MTKENASWVGLVLADGRYCVVAKLGEGGMGFVYRAHDLHLDNQDVVIKVPRRAMLEDPGFAGRFAREVRSLVRLAHPHIVKVSDAGVHDGLPFAVMQYLSGGSLRDRQQRDQDGSHLPLPPEELHSWLPGVAAALDFIHERNHIHRDVKPDNILFDGGGHVYLSDFGVAKVLADNLAPKPRTVHTGTGMVLGTPQYMAPELIMGERYDGRVDQYALAVTIYELVTGRLPAEGPTPAAILVQQTTNIPIPLAELIPSVLETLSAAVAKALSREPDDRYPNCTTFAQEALEGIPRTGIAPAPRTSGPESYRVSCPSCRKKLILRPTSQGKWVRCSSCGEMFQAPTISKPARTGSAPVISETDTTEEARVETRTGAAAEPFMIPDANASGPDPIESFAGETGDESVLHDYDSAITVRGRYLFLALSATLAFFIVVATLIVIFSRKTPAPAPGSHPTKPSIAHKSPQHDADAGQDPQAPQKTPPPPPAPIETRTSPLPSQNPLTHGQAMGNDDFNAGASSPSSQAVNPVSTPPPRSDTGNKPAQNEAQEPLPEPDGGLRARMETYIRDQTHASKLKIVQGHPPVRKTRGQTEGLLYRVDVRYWALEYKQKTYYLFVVDDKIVAGAWDEDKLGFSKR